MVHFNPSMRAALREVGLSPDLGSDWDASYLELEPHPMQVEGKMNLSRKSAYRLRTSAGYPKGCKRKKDHRHVQGIKRSFS